MKRMVLAATILCLALTNKIAADQASIGTPNVDSLVGWPSGDAVRQEITWERLFLQQPSAANADAIERQLSSVPHRAGTTADYATAIFVRDRLQADGFNAKLIPYDALFTGPITLGVERLSPQPKNFDMLEGEPGNHTQWETLAGPGFVTSSPDGVVTGPLYYLNYGTADDWAALEKMGVSFAVGAIALLRTPDGLKYTATLHQDIYRELVRHHVGAVIAFDDPASYGYVQGEVWPKGPYRNDFIVERKGDLYGPEQASFWNDPSLPGQIAYPGIPHKSWEQIPHSAIVHILVSGWTGRELLAGMSGPTVPSNWHDAHELVERVGGNQQIRVTVKMEHKIVRIWQVVGVLPGRENPEQLVLLGGHRDAMSYGAIDNGSGTTAVLQIADGLAALAKQGWHPRRSVQVISSDGHELGLFGTASYSRQFGDYLNEHAFFSVDGDQITAAGNQFWGNSGPDTREFVNQIGQVVTGADGKILFDKDPARWLPLTYGPGETGAMYRAPGISYAGYVEPFGTHHSAEDNLDGYQTFDPGYKKAVVVAQFLGLAVMRADGAAVTPLRISQRAQLLIDNLKTLEKRLPPTTHTTQLSRSLQEFLAAAQRVDSSMITAERSGDTATMQASSAKELAAIAAFWDPGQIPASRTRHYIDGGHAAYPEVEAVLDENKPNKLAPALARMDAAVRAATTALR